MEIVQHSDDPPRDRRGPASSWAAATAHSHHQTPLQAPSEISSQAGESSLDPAVVDLLGVLAYGELTGFMRLTADAEMAPNLRTKTILAALAVQEFARFERVMTFLDERGADAEAAMTPYLSVVADYHERTRPTDWVEGLVKAYVGDGIARDFYREIVTFLPEESKAVVQPVLEQPGQGEFIVATVRAVLAEEPSRAGRLALYARRLVGEALYQAQRVAAEQEHLAALLMGGAGLAGSDLAAFSRMLTRITDEHGRRMGLLGLNP